jgi:hypothetical protein
MSASLGGMIPTYNRSTKITIPLLESAGPECVESTQVRAKSEPGAGFLNGNGIGELEKRPKGRGCAGDGPNDDLPWAVNVDDRSDPRSPRDRAREPSSCPDTPRYLA